MSKPKNKEEYRQQLADMFAHVLEEKGLEWHQEWTQSGRNGAPYNIVTGAKYRGSNSFYLSLVALVNGYQDPRWVTMVQIMDKKGNTTQGRRGTSRLAPRRSGWNTGIRMTQPTGRP